ncbi:hypothetical protein SAMN00120144_3560 [Hymenobacter roseosalivarius DSM 11622]|uniref:Uncharacterized protein n=1 Tax=Hymenobacter roseosalivarius DSM 11622 TaxID=645990 RepID=A0A1W1W227_9BACT|nr:hypothetical protein [Hymenobacter roseosalivarius]SMB99679.1 hypothetical protein SAMN00120144_3560 [Hymenobacter roseosalivarius DSM 11622]
MDSLLELACRTLSLRPDLQVLVVRGHSHASFAVGQADDAQMLAIAETAGLHHWLLEVRCREKTMTERSAWVGETFYPQAVARLAPQRLRRAVLSSPALTPAYRTDADQQKYVAYSLDAARPYNIGLFEDEGLAMRWLSPVLRSSP